MSSVSYESVGKEFGSVTALQDVSFEVADGEFMVLLGPSGSGKTTALRILAGLETLSAGHIRIDDRVVDRLSPRERDIAMVFQDYALYPQMTVFENLGFSLRLRKLPRTEIRNRVETAAKMLDIHGLLNRKPRELSGGQRQRVALGRALVREPKVFLMDEPLSNLDAKLRLQTRGDIRRLQRDVGITTLYVTHDQVEAMTMGDRIVVMHDGRIAQVGTPTAVYDDPVNMFVAGFIGNPAMAFGSFAASHDDGVVRLECERACVEVPVTRQLPGEVIVGVRPERVSLWADEKRLLGPLEGRVEFMEDLGREQLVNVRVARDVAFLVQAQERTGMALDDSVRIGLQPGHIHLFDPNTGLAIGRV